MELHQLKQELDTFLDFTHNLAMTYHQDDPTNLKKSEDQLVQRYNYLNNRFSDFLIEFKIWVRKGLILSACSAVERFEDVGSIHRALGLRLWSGSWKHS